MHLLFGLADGRLATPIRQRAVVGGYVLCTAVGVAGMAERDHFVIWPSALLWIAAVGFGLYAANVRYVKAGAIDRRRMQWVGWGMAVATEAAIVIVALRLLTDWPDHARRRGVGDHRPRATGAHIGDVADDGRPRRPPAHPHGGDRRADGARCRRLRRRRARPGAHADRIRAGPAAPVDGGRRPVRARVSPGTTIGSTERANRLVYGERVSPDELLRTFGQRLTRSIPMDELLLQLTESLRRSMVLQSAEVWTGQGGHLELAAGVPHRQPDPISIGPKETPVVARAGVSGGTWLDIWLPAIVGPGGSGAMRVAPVAHGGELLGLITVTRRRDGEPFTESEDRVLTELARQVALALHNVQLDAALQASLEELQVRNAQLQESRARIVAAGDAERRKLERNLHDGAQQHLVALAVKLRLTRDAVEDDPADAIAMIDEIKGNLQDAIQELRSLAHGIFPPLLVSGGLAEALPAAAARAVPPRHRRHGRDRSLFGRDGGGRLLLRSRGAAERGQACR